MDRDSGAYLLTLAKLIGSVGKGGLYDYLSWVEMEAKKLV